MTYLGGLPILTSQQPGKIIACFLVLWPFANGSGTSEKPHPGARLHAAFWGYQMALPPQ